jgi:hypothetical protein
MVDGSSFDIPHRDYIWFFPPRETLSGKKVVQGTSFMVADHRGWESMRLVNALLVVEAMPLPPNSTRGRKRKAS